jgi:hypothetical protein
MSMAAALLLEVDQLLSKGPEPAVEGQGAAWFYGSPARGVFALDGDDEVDRLKWWQAGYRYAFAC